MTSPQQTKLELMRVCVGAVLKTNSGTRVQMLRTCKPCWDRSMKLWVQSCSVMLLSNSIPVLFCRFFIHFGDCVSPFSVFACVRNGSHSSTDALIVWNYIIDPQVWRMWRAGAVSSFIFSLFSQWFACTAKALLYFLSSSFALLELKEMWTEI